MAVFTYPGRQHVAVLARSDVMLMELGLVHQLFTRARARDEAPLYEVVTCGLEPGELATNADFSIWISHGPDVLRDADTVIVLASHADDGATDGRPSARLVEAFDRIQPGTRIASICTGAFALASVGLLDGKRATTHWQSAALFRQLYPTVSLDPDVLYIDEGSVLTSAGEASGIDLCLHMIRSDHGAAVANEVARTTVVPPHRDGGQAQYIRVPMPESTHAGTATARAWALRHLHQRISLRDLAEQESMSVRTFTRRFHDATGISPAQWLIQQRIQRARQLLEDTDLSVDRIADDAGFGTTAALRQHLHAALGVSPTAYRTTFRGPGAPAAHEPMST